MECKSGHIYGKEEKARAVALYQNTGSIRAASIQTGVARSTLRNWIRQSGVGEPQPSQKTSEKASLQRDDTSRSCQKRKADQNQDFLHCASEAMADALLLMQRQVQTALRSQDELDALLLAIRYDDDTPQKERVDTAKAIAKMAQPDMRDMMNAINAMYERMKDMDTGRRGQADLSGLSTDEIRSILAVNGHV